MRGKVTDHLSNEFESVELMCEHWETPVDVFKLRIEAGWTIEDALTYPLRQNDLDNAGIEPELNTIKGRFKTLKSLAELCKFSYSALHKRLNEYKWDIDTAVVIPTRDRVVAKGIGKKTGRLYYRVKWSSTLVTARQIIEHYEPNLLQEYDRMNPQGKYRPYRI